jgi:hypothetical protein
VAEPHPAVTYSKKGAKFQDVREDLKLAIEERGLVIDYVSYVNRMLERTGKDVGSARKLYTDAQAFVFCSAALSPQDHGGRPGERLVLPRPSDSSKQNVRCFGERRHDAV